MLTFAIVSGASGAESKLAALCRVLGDSIGRPLIPRVLPSYAALKEELDAGLADVVWAPPLIAAELEGAGTGRIELLSTRDGRTGYHAAIFTSHASRIEKLADLQGAHVAWVDVFSAAGYLAPRMRIMAEGLDPDTLFGRESFLKTHAKVACAVLDGEADVGATYAAIEPLTMGGPEGGPSKPPRAATANGSRPSEPSGTARHQLVSAGWLEAGAGINGAFVVATAGPIPSDAIVLASGLPDDLAISLRAEIQRLPELAPEALGRLLRADGFVPPTGEHREALQALRLAARKRR